MIRIEECIKHKFVSPIEVRLPEYEEGAKLVLSFSSITFRDFAIASMNRTIRLRYNEKKFSISKVKEYEVGEKFYKYVMLHFKNGVAYVSYSTENMFGKYFNGDLIPFKYGKSSRFVKINNSEIDTFVEISHEYMKKKYSSVLTIQDISYNYNVVKKI